MNKLLKISKLYEIHHSNFKLDEFRVQMFVFLRNTNLIKLEILKIFEPKLGKLVSKLKLKLKKFIFLKLDMCLNSKIFKLDEM